MACANNTNNEHKSKFTKFRSKSNDERLPVFTLSEEMSGGIDTMLKLYQSELESSGLGVPSPQEIIDALNSLDDTDWNVMNSVQILAAAYVFPFKEYSRIRIVYLNDEITNLVNKVMNHILESTKMKICVDVFCADSFYGLEKDGKKKDFDRIAAFTNPEYKERIVLSVNGKFGVEEIQLFISRKIRFGLPIMISDDMAFFPSINWDGVKKYTTVIEFCISPDLDPRVLNLLPRKWLVCQIHFRGINLDKISRVCKILEFLDKNDEREFCGMIVIFSRWDVPFENQKVKEMLSILKERTFASSHFDTVFPMTKGEKISVKEGYKRFYFNEGYFTKNPPIHL